MGARTFLALLEWLGSPHSVFEQAQAGHLDGRLAQGTLAYLKSPDWAPVERGLAWREAPDNHILVLHDPAYPSLLKEIPDPPPVLYACGDPRVLSAPQLAMVGSRNPSPAGLDNAFGFSRSLVAAGLTITSSLALGIDAASHKGALAARGTTVAVAGTGLDRIYPARHRELALQIRERGALVSEFPLGTPPAGPNFPRRNRIISGLSRGVLVVEAASSSGSLITARFAAEQSREVFAIPGSIHHSLARGCHALIRQGAKLVETANDILEELGPPISWLQARHVLAGSPIARNEATGLTVESEKVLEHMGFDAVTVDMLVERTRLTTEVVSSILLMLELQGDVSSTAGGLYVRLPKRV